MSDQYTPTTEQIREAYVEHRDRATYSPSAAQDRRYRDAGGAAGEFDRWLASLSQPTPTAEGDDRYSFLDSEGVRVRRAAPLPAEPPRIEDMAPGTTFTARQDALPPERPRRLYLRTAGGPATPLVIDAVTADAVYDRLIIPSTIRDVTPPSAEVRS